MTCSGCEAKVKWLLEQTSGVTAAVVNLTSGEARLDMQAHVLLADLQQALKDYTKYQITEQVAETVAVPASWLTTYKPILLIFAFISGITLLIEARSGAFDSMRWMGHFMAGFFLVFSFFKLLNLRAFADSYAGYDIVARRWRSWGYIYAFAELALGIAFLTGFRPLLTNAFTFVLMSVSIAGVLQSVLQKRKVVCACLGAVFNLPMSTVTIIEDALMIAMSGLMILQLL